jgi:hypothetical protein
LRDTNIQSDVPLTGRESLGDYAPFEAGTRVYVTLPTGDRVGFTFEPVKQSIPGLVYYTPAFVADPGVNWTLQSAATQLSRIGSRFYDLQTGQPYNPAGWSTGTQYTLVAPDGTSYEIDASLGVTGIDFTDGVHFAVSGSGIYAPNGDAVSFVGGTSGITKVIGPDGDQVVYLYDTQGNLTLARDLVSGASDRYGYATSAVATVTVNVSNASLVRINLPDIGPLVTGDIQKLQITGDFTDATGVVVPISYLNLTSTDPKTVSVSSDGTVKAVASGNAVISASSHGITAVKAVLVSDPDPTGQGDGPTVTPLIAYPGAVSLLSNGGTRQLDISTQDGTDVTPSADGTLYFTSNPDIATVTADGFVTGVNPGVATITAINNGSESDISVRVQVKSVGPTLVGSDGGIVQGSDGSLVAVGPAC